MVFWLRAVVCQFLTVKEAGFQEKWSKWENTEKWEKHHFWENTTFWSENTVLSKPPQHPYWGKGRCQKCTKIVVTPKSGKSPKSVKSPNRGNHRKVENAIRLISQRGQGGLVPLTGQEVQHGSVHGCCGPGWCTRWYGSRCHHVVHARVLHWEQKTATSGLKQPILG